MATSKPHAKDWYLAEAQALVERDYGLRVMQQAMDRMSHLDYSLPEPLQELQWMRNYRTTDPFNALRGATRTLAKLEEQLHIDEISVLKAVPGGNGDSSPAARQKANEWEQCLKWNMRRATARNQIFRSDVIRSAVLYDEICAQIVHLPTQRKAMGKLGNQRRLADKRFGDFAINLRNPQSVHTRYSDYLCEAVLSVTCRTPQEIVDTWGEAAGDIAQLIEDDEAGDYYLLCDYTDYDGRAVWVIEGDNESRIGDAKEKDVLWIVKPVALDYPILPWVVVAGGTNLDGDPAHQRLPLLYPIYRSELWLNANITGSLMASEAVAKGASPSMIKTGPDPNSILVEYGQPGGSVDAPPGHDVKPFQKDRLDPALAELFDRHKQEIGEATLARVLITSEAAPGETFAGFNLRVMTAVGQLLPYQDEGQRFFSQVYEQMLLWAHHTGTPLVGYGESKDTQGQRYVIDSEDIDPDALYLNATLVADVPIDRLQKIQGAMQIRQLGAPMSYALQELGVEDPEKMIADGINEQFLLAKVEGYKQMILAEASGQLQQMAMQMAQGIVQQQQQQAAGGAPEDQGALGQLANPTGPGATPGVPGAQGQSPARGGLPAAMFDPGGATFEGQTGGARNGVPVQ